MCAAAFLVMEADRLKRRASFSHYCGGRFQAARPGQARAALPAVCRQGKGETLFGSDARSVADPLSHGD